MFNTTLLANSVVRLAKAFISDAMEGYIEGQMEGL
jgi:hypothetical protein